MAAQNPLNIALLVTAESSASTLFGMYDLFCSVGRDWPLVTEGQEGERLVTPTLVSETGRGFYSTNGVWIQPQAAFAKCAEPDVICIPDLLVAPSDVMAGRYVGECDWLKTQFTRGAYIATACTGALLLAEAGLLAGHATTTHWAYCDAMRAQYRNVQVHGERAMVVGGEGQRLLMAGGGTSWMDLALLIVARFINVEEAMRLARLYLIDWHHMGQQPYTVLTGRSQTDDALMAECQVWAAQHYEQESPVAKMAAISGLTDRTFNRRFAKATGLTPLEYVHALRLEEAKHLLETTVEPIEAVANTIGYEDAGFFGRLFKRKVGLNPAQYRKRFGALRRSLKQLPTSQ